MEDTRIEQIDSDIYKITKGTYSIVVANCCGTVIIISLTHSINDVPMVLWNNQFREPKAARQKLYHLIGKMCTKTVDSKYFKNVRTSEHMLNGGDTFNHDTAILEKLATGLFDKVNKRKGMLL